MKDVETLIQELGFCGCGIPDMVLRMIRDGLENTRAFHEEKGTFEERVGLYDNWLNGWFPSEEAKDFFLSVMDQQGLMEHGTGMRGSWLTDKGKTFLADANEALAIK